MKILIIGATGETGQRLLKLALQADHEVTLYIRDNSKLQKQSGGEACPECRVIVGDVFDRAALVEACRDQDVVINAAGNVSDGEQFETLVKTVSQAVEEGLGTGGRFWFFGGAGALEVPGTNKMTVNLPKIPPLFRAHERNYKTVRATSLNWSMLCPGPMTAAVDGQPHRDLRISTDIWPVPRPAVTRMMPPIATALAFKLKIPEMTIAYEDAARVILENLIQDGPLVKKRVGVALPHGMKRSKDIRALTGQRN